MSATASPPAKPARKSISPLARTWRSFWRRPATQIASVVLGLMVFVSIFAPWIAPYSPATIDMFNMLAPPSPQHWLGTDENGRDILTRLIYGGRVSLSVGLASVAAAVVIGATLGALAGFLGGWVDSLISRIIDGMLSIPLFFFLLTTLALFGSSLPNLILVIALTTWMPVARIVRGEITANRELQYVEAAAALGVPKMKILFRHVLPQSTPSIIVAATLGIAEAIIVESALSYLGFGVRPPTPSWGNMLAEARGYIFQNPLLTVYPGALIFISVLAFNTIGDAMRDATDPRK
ncbi:ABC transporter permease [Arsenicitalea aurantiaca]|uniref:ABC transporter permease n=1 Tax=Arsenicitalea aurantiaca TaxID=1783274 RepID=A0A433XAZ0_9HYPH|nr:ABC transporter permease [Arsenicitalea aurantiaca]RUT31257.1 ABC transporter permease [Arsenicitalea aurantiaca]